MKEYATSGSVPKYRISVCAIGFEMDAAAPVGAMHRFSSSIGDGRGGHDVFAPSSHPDRRRRRRSADVASLRPAVAIAPTSIASPRSTRPARCGRRRGKVYDLAQAAEALRVSEARHFRGKLVLRVR